MSEKCGGKAVGGGEETILWCDACEGFERFLCKGVIPSLTGEGVQADQGDGGDRVCTGRWRILKGFAAHVEAAHGCGVGGTVEESAAFGVAVPGDGEIHRLLCGVEIARLQSGFVGIEKRQDAEDLIVERAIERGDAEAGAEAAGFATDL